MPKVRLVGLFLFITAICIALAAAATRTTHVRFHRPSNSPPPSDPNDGPVDVAPKEVAVPNPADAESYPEPNFASVPILYPLAGLATAGLTLWFFPSLVLPSSGKRRRPKRRRKRR